MGSAVMREFSIQSNNVSGDADYRQPSPFGEGSETKDSGSDPRIERRAASFEVDDIVRTRWRQRDLSRNDLGVFQMPYNSKSRKILQSLDKETLEQLYWGSDNSLLSLARELNVSETGIYQRLVSLGIPRKEARKSAVVIEPTPEEEQVILGTILGDGWISIPSTRAAYLAFAHGAKQEAYIRWKALKLKRFATPRGVKFSPRTADASGKLHDAYEFWTRSCPYFAYLEQLFYIHANGKRVKTVASEVLEKLDRLGLAVWYMDDGSWHSGDPRIVVSVEWQDVLRGWFASRWGLAVRYYILKASPKVVDMVFRPNSGKFVRLVADFIIPSMKYKVGAKVETR